MFRVKVLDSAAANGCSEMATALVTGIITMMFNWTMLRNEGADRVAAAFVLTRPLVCVFARPDNPVYDLAVAGSRLCTSALFFIGFHIFASGMFAALSNGVVSAVLAFSRSFIFMPITMFVLLLFLGLDRHLAGNVGGRTDSACLVFDIWEAVWISEHQK